MSEHEDVAVGLFVFRSFRYGLGWEIPRLAPLARDDCRRLHRIAAGVDVAVEGAGDHVFVGLDCFRIGVLGF